MSRLDSWSAFGFRRIPFQTTPMNWQRKSIDAEIVVNASPLITLGRGEPD